MKRTAILLAAGFEETEAIVPIDVLRRAGVAVILAGVAGEATVEGAHGITLVTDAGIDDLDPQALDMVILPGGMPGSTNLAASTAVRKLVQSMLDNGRFVAAICAAPLALQAAGVLSGRTVTAYPGVEQNLSDAVYSGAVVTRDDTLITGQGPGAVFAFAFALLQALDLDDQAAAIAAAMLVKPVL